MSLGLNPDKVLRDYHEEALRFVWEKERAQNGFQTLLNSLSTSRVSTGKSLIMYR